MIHPKRLLDDLKRLLRRLEADLRERAGTVAELHELQQREYRAAREAGRTGESFAARLCVCALSGGQWPGGGGTAVRAAGAPPSGG